MKGFCAILVFLSGCSASSVPPCEVGGTYVVSYQRDTANPGNCTINGSATGAFTPDTATITQTGNAATVAFGGAGSCSNATIDAAKCKLTVDCPLLGGTAGNSLQLSWTFNASSKAISGESFFNLGNASTGQTCSANMLVSGTPK